MPVPARRLPVSIAAVLLLPLGALAESQRFGPELQVNTYTEGQQLAPAVAASPGGGFVVAWSSFPQDGSYYGVFARRFASTGAPVASEFQVNQWTYDSQTAVSLAANAQGEYVVAWQSYGRDGSHFGIVARRFTSAGAALGSEIGVNSFTDGPQRGASVAADAEGDFVVVWHSEGQDGSLGGIFAQRFSSAGVALGSELHVNTHTLGDERYPAVAAEGDGDFVVAWQSGNFFDGQGFGVAARRFSSTGAPLATELLVNTTTLGNQTTARVGMSGNGSFVVVWEGYPGDGSADGIFGQRFSSDGAPVGSEFQVNTFTTDRQFGPSVTAHDDGDFVVAWHSFLQDTSSFGVFAREFSSDGVALASELQVNTHTLGNQMAPALSSDAAGRFVVAWVSNGQDGSAYGIFAQRFGTPATLDIDLNGSVGALTDGLLVLRYLFGFRGSTLVGGVVDTFACGRCEAAEIESYLAGLV